MSDEPRFELQVQRELNEVRLAYGAACASLRAARELADSARDVVRFGATRHTMARLDTALAVWEARSGSSVRKASEVAS